MTGGEEGQLLDVQGEKLKRCFHTCRHFHKNVIFNTYGSDPCEGCPPGGKFSHGRSAVS